ncbi:MAG: amino acid adenylation domain-containing protein [Candidatus Aminicenantes bacterium]|nr:MAG: amino acid adenylation domain-containing protein [Candidatus Aminicenantes bacterium]
MKQDSQLNELIFDARIRLKEREYWLNKLSGELLKSSFPFDMSKKPGHERSMKRLNFAFTGETFSRFMRLSNHSDIRLYIILTAGVMVLIDKYTGNQDIIVGTPIYRQEVESDLINKILALRHQLSNHMTFKELLLQLSKTNSEAVQNINYPIETLPHELNMTFHDNEFPLFDIAVLVENIHEKSYIDHLNLNVIFSFLRTGESVEGVLEYNAGLYRQETMERIMAHFINVMQHALFGIDAKISDISILSEEETRQLVFDFNDTRTDYPRDKTIHQLFEEQVKRGPGHTALIGTTYHPIEGAAGNRPEVTYQELDEKATQLAQVLRDKGMISETIAAVLLDRSIELITAVLAVLKAGGAYLPVDMEYPADRINYLLEDSHTKLLLASGDPGDKVKFAGTIIDVGNERLYRGERANPEPLEPLSCADNLAYVIYTSGTTGKPKGVMIEHRAVVNYVWWAAKTYVRNERVNFPLYSSIAFDLTVTSLFTPLVTGNTIVIYAGTAKDFLIEHIIDDNQVEIIKLTPSHLYVIKYKAIDQSNIRRFIVGGEELETRIAREIDTLFKGKVEIYNEYGPTEATVGCVFYKFNPAEENSRSVPIGVPTDNAQIYLLDRDRKPVPVGVQGEIYISGDSVARGYLNSVELTAEKFITFYRSNRSDKTYISNKIYQSGDMARWLPDGNIEYLGRADHQVKIRGYRVELGEIEQQLLQHEAVKEVVVVARDGREKNAGDEKADLYLCAYFVSDSQVGVSQLKNYLQQYLSDYMIPLFFVQLEEIPLTSNGKVNRKALPEPEINLDQEYAAPSDEIEEKLVAVWSELLVIEKERISIDANFFELGGHSLKQVGLISQIHKEFNVKISLAEIFRIPTIRGLSKYIRDSVEEPFASLEPAEEKEYYLLALPQKRFYIFQQLDPESIAYNIYFVLLLEGEVEKETFQEVFTQLIRRHESLRTSLELINEEPMQRVHDHDEVEFQVEYAEIEEKENQSQLAANLINHFIRPFDLARAPLFRVGLIKLAAERHIFLVDMHHTITDGISERIITEEFLALCGGERLSPLRFQYKDYSGWQASEEQRVKIEGQGEFWLKQFEDGIPILKLLTDFPRPALQGFEGSALDFDIPAEQTGALKELALEQEASLYMVLLGVYYILLSKLSGQEDIIVGTGVSGREHADLMKIIGLMFNTIPLRNRVVKEKRFLEWLKDLKTRTIEAFENQDYPFDQLVENLVNRKLLIRDASRNPIFDTMFAMQNFRENIDFLSEQETLGLNVKPYEYETRLSRFDLFLYGSEINDFIRMRLEYSTALFKKSTAERIKNYYMKILSQILENKEIKIKDITILTASAHIDLKPEVDQNEYMDFVL